MEVITKLLHRRFDLNDTAHENFYLELGDTVRLHYRDLRIDLTRAEFEKFCEVFAIQSAELKKIMTEMDYRDGAPENKEREVLKVWTNSKLDPQPACNPKRLSLEESVDGLHLRYRNLRLILDDKTLCGLRFALHPTNSQKPHAATMEEFEELLQINGIYYELSKQSGTRFRGTAAYPLTIQEYQAPAVRRILTGIGMDGKLLEDGKVVYAKKGLALELIVIPEDEDEAVSIAQG